ncbi:MAG: hypothetical protein ACK5LM_01415 [Lactovum sp.]
MIIINMAMKQEFIIELLESNGYKYVKKQGIKLYFETPSEDLDADAVNAKALIKASEFGSVLFFNIEVEK